MTTPAPLQPIPSSASTLLLLDAENMDLPRGLEYFLVTEVSPFPVRYRYAFGNWRALGERDLILHSRGYQLVHVPPAKNSADMHMALDGLTLIHKQPDIQAVFICSNDKDLDHLSNTLIRSGVIPYRVYRHQATCQIDNLLDGTTCNFNIDDPDRLQARTLAEVSFQAAGLPFAPIAARFSPYLIRMRLQKILQEVTLTRGNEAISIGELGSLYRQRYNQPLRDALRGCELRASLKEFLQSHPDAFILTTPRSNRALTYVRLRHQPPPPVVTDIPTDLPPDLVKKVEDQYAPRPSHPQPCADSDLSPSHPTPLRIGLPPRLGSGTPHRPQLHPPSGHHHRHPFPGKCPDTTAVAIVPPCGNARTHLPSQTQCLLPENLSRTPEANPQTDRPSPKHRQIPDQILSFAGSSKRQSLLGGRSMSGLKEWDPAEVIIIGDIPAIASAGNQSICKT